jgi:hypothetical protein
MSIEPRAMATGTSVGRVGGGGRALLGWCTVSALAEPGVYPTSIDPDPLG